MNEETPLLTEISNTIEQLSPPFTQIKTSNNTSVELSTQQLHNFFARIDKNNDSTMLDRFGLNAQNIIDYLNTPAGKTTKTLIQSQLLQIIAADERLHEEVAEEEENHQEQLIAYLLLILAKHHLHKMAELFCSIEDEIESSNHKQNKEGFLPSATDVSFIEVLEKMANKILSAEDVLEGKHIIVHNGKEYFVPKSIDSPEKLANLTITQRENAANEGLRISKDSKQLMPVKANTPASKPEPQIVDTLHEANQQSQLHMIQAARAIVQTQVVNNAAGISPVAAPGGSSSKTAKTPGKITVNYAAGVLRAILQKEQSPVTQRAAQRLVGTTWGTTAATQAFNRCIAGFERGKPINPNSLQQLIKQFMKLGTIEAKNINSGKYSAHIPDNIPDDDPLPKPGL